MKTMTLVSKNNDALVFQYFKIIFSVLEALGKIQLNSMLLRHRLECKKPQSNLITHSVMFVISDL